MAETYGKQYKTVQENVMAIQLKISTMESVYHFMDNADITLRIAHGDITATITDKNGVKFGVSKFEWIVKDSDDGISVWNDTDFKKKFIEV